MGYEFLHSPRSNGGHHGLSDRAREQAMHAYHRSWQKMHESGDRLEHFIEEQPVRSALIVIGLSCLACALFLRR